MTKLADLNSVADYATTLLAALPSGRVWPRDADSTMARAVTTLAPTFYRVAQRAVDLLEESPAGDSLVELLPEWETSLGLPDACTGPLPTIAQRQAAVVAKLVARGGQSVPYLVGVATALGFTITVTEFAPARADEMCADDPVNDPSWADSWQVNAPEVTIGYFAADENYTDEPLAWWGNEQLTCTLARIKPAHTALLYLFGEALSGSGSGGGGGSSGSVTADSTMITADSTTITADAA